MSDIPHRTMSSTRHHRAFADAVVPSRAKYVPGSDVFSTYCKHNRKPILHHFSVSTTGWWWSELGEHQLQSDLVALIGQHDMKLRWHHSNEPTQLPAAPQGTDICSTNCKHCDEMHSTGFAAQSGIANEGGEAVLIIVIRILVHQLDLISVPVTWLLGKPGKD